MTRRDLVLFSPLPPSRNGIADYTASFLPALADRFDLCVVIDDIQPTPPADPAFRILRVAEYARHHGAFRSAAHAYQIGNNSGHSYMLPWIGRAPGLVTIHDLSLHHLMDVSLTGNEIGEPYSQLLFEAYGQRGLTLAREVVRRRERPLVYHMELGLLPLLLDRSLGVVVHSLLGELRCSAGAKAVPVYRIAHAYDKRAVEWLGDRDAIRSAAKRQLHFREDKIVISSLGFVKRVKCLDLVLAAVRTLRDLGYDVLLVIAGEVDLNEYDVPSRIRAYGVGDCVEVIDYLPDELFMAYIAATDVLVNLRYPSMGETSGTLTNALAIGCCTVVTEIGSYAEIPDDCCAHVPVPEMNVEGLLKVLTPLVASKALRGRYEANAAQFARQAYAPEPFVERYSAAIEETARKLDEAKPERPFLERPFTSKQGRRKVQIAGAKIAQLHTPRAAMWWSELLLPHGEREQSLLVVGESAFAEAMARDRFGWAESAVCVQSVDRFLSDPEFGERDVVLMVLDERAFLASAMELIALVNRTLRTRGTLVIDVVFANKMHLASTMSASENRSGLTPNQTSQTVNSMLEAGGFRADTVRDRSTETNPRLAATEQLELAIVATKISDRVELRPASVFLPY